jgi:two-component system, OmpR family, alkaline phosphatase synthesis response regulator PhoP
VCGDLISMSRTILLVDDEPRIVEIARDYLRAAGYEVLTADNGQRAMQVLRAERPALVVLDLMLPLMDGLAVTQAMRRDRELAAIPIVMLTARVEEADKLAGLELGADDYLTKPFSPRELVARVRAVLRRVDGERAPTSVLRFGDLVIDLDMRNVTVGGRAVDLTSTEFELVRVLARSPGRPFTREQLLDQAYNGDYDGYDRTIDAHIKNLRRKIEPDPRSPRYILTIYGIGYKWTDA